MDFDLMSFSIFGIALVLGVILLAVAKGRGRPGG
jgi:hypothetical protein